MGGPRVTALAAACWILLQGCAGPWRQEGDAYVERGNGLAIADPARGPGGWRRVEVPGASLAFQGERGATMSLVRQCGRPAAPLPILARALLAGTDEPAVARAEPVQVGGAEGWLQVARAGVDGRAADVKTVTRRLGDCTLDFVLVAPAGLASAEADFDAWWRSFRPGPDGAGAGVEAAGSGAAASGVDR